MSKPSTSLTKFNDQWTILIHESFDIRDELKAAGATYSPTHKAWRVSESDPKMTVARTASVVRKHGGDPTLLDKALRIGWEELAEQVDQDGNLTGLSYVREEVDIEADLVDEPQDDLTEFPIPLFPFQRVGARFARERKGSLIADEMGSGKTLQSLAAAALDPRVLVVCPAVVKTHWSHEAARALIAEPQILSGSKEIKIEEGTRVVVVNYDVLKHHVPELVLWAPTTVILDEAHMIKNPKSQRTKAIKELVKITDPRVITLSGTPMMNRPVELIPILQLTGAFEDVGGDWMSYVKNFCNARRTRWGWDTNGSSNLDLLAQRLNETIMIRRTKADVLKQLPPKSRRVVELDIESSLAAYRQVEKEATDLFATRVKELQKEGLSAAKAIRAATKEPEGAAQISQLRLQVGLAKLDVAAGFILEHVESTGRKIVVFVHHKEVRAGLIERLQEAGQKVVEIGGDTSQDDRDAAVKAFQEDPETMVFIGSTAASVGITLTAASDVVLVEGQWTPAIVDQSEDRVHRIGQDAEAVTAWHLLAPELAVDMHMWRTVERKRRVAAKSLGDPMAQDPSVIKGGRGAAGYVASLLKSKKKLEVSEEDPDLDDPEDS
jgi:SWI/SNF-related matrix-associated actin-dependent regulator 1 of chromatin subfamily A